MYSGDCEQLGAILQIPSNLLTDLKSYVYSVNVEVSGFLLGTLEGDGKYKTTGIHVSRQVVHSADVDVEDVDTISLARRLKKKTDDTFKEKLVKDPGLIKHPLYMATSYRQLEENAERVICQWHSHVDMRVFMSGRDEATLNDLAKEYGAMIMMIMNKHDERKLWIRSYRSVLVRNAPVSLEVTEEEGECLSRKEIVNTIKENLFHSRDFVIPMTGDYKGTIIPKESNVRDTK